MTRLKEDDIKFLVPQMAAYDRKLMEQIGYSIGQIARHTVERKGNAIYRVAVIPVTSGLGIIGGFSETVCGILTYCGIDAFVTQQTDVGGIQEAYAKKADILFLADDDVASAFTLQGKKFSDNGYATGSSFAAALELCIQQRKKKEETDSAEILILGVGPVGQAAGRYLKKKGMQVWVYDKDLRKAEAFVQKEDGIHLCKDFNEKKRFRYFVEATTEADVIQKEDVSEQTILAAPGMPLGAQSEAADIATVIHNPLELGILTMYHDCAKSLDEIEEKRRE